MRFYPAIDDRDRQCATRLEWAIKQHRDLAEDDLDELQAEYEVTVIIRQSKEVYERKYHQMDIANFCNGQQATRPSQSSPKDSLIARINGLNKYCDA